jgi:hypothetical protein
MPAETSRPPFVLITNGWLNGRSGTEVVTRDYALGLARRGWRVAAHAQHLGPPMSEELRGHVELVHDLAALDETPDLIHGQHHPKIVPALVRFPAAPAIQLCHDPLVWFDEALRLERIRARAAVDTLCRARVAREAGVPEDSVALLPNAIDFGHCRPRPPLPERPRRALIVAHHSADHVPACVAACQQAGLEVALAGFAAGRPLKDLPGEMAGFDIVFGAARIALEALAVGCAVVVCDARGLAGMARSADFAAWRPANFGRALLTSPVTPETVGRALADYAPQDAAELSAQVRAECGLEAALDRLEAFYAQAIAAHRAAPPIDAAREAADLAAYLQRALSIDVWGSPWGDAHERLSNEAALKTAKLDGLIAELQRRGLNVQFETESGAPAP